MSDGPASSSRSMRLTPDGEVEDRVQWRRRPKRAHRHQSREDSPRVRAGSILTSLLARQVRKVLRFVEAAGRYSLYLGLLLVALTSLRLPGGVGGVADPILFFSLVCALLAVVFGHREIRLSLLKAHIIGLALFIFGILISTAAESPNEAASLINLLKFIFATSGIIFACLVLLRRNRQIEIALGCWIVSAAISSLFGIMQASLGASAPGYVEGSWGRMAGLSQTANGLGGIAAIAIAPALSLAAVQPDWPRRLQWLLATILCIAGVAVSASRIGALTALVCLIVWAGMHYRLDRRLTTILAGMALAAAAAAVVLFVSSGGLSVTDRLAKATDPDRDNAVKERLYHYEYVIDEALANPLVGVGLAKSDAQVWGVDVHNTFLLSLRTGGLLSLIGIFVMIFDGIRKGVFAYFHSNNYSSKAISLGLFVGVVGFVVSGLTEPFLYHRQVWIPMALVIVLFSLMRTSQRMGKPKRAR